MIAVVVARPATAFPGARGVVCPNLLQRPRPTRSAGGESLILRTSARRRSRRGAPLQQIRNTSPPRESYSGGVCVVLVGLLWRPGAGACPNLPQRRSGPGSAVRRSAEYQRFFSRAPARSGPLWQIRTNGATAGPGRGVMGRRSRGPDGVAQAGAGPTGPEGPAPCAPLCRSRPRSPPPDEKGPMTTGVDP